MCSQHQNQSGRAGGCKADAQLRWFPGVGKGSAQCSGLAANPVQARLDYGTAWPAKTPVHRSLSTATWPFTTTKGIPVGY